MPKTLYMIPDQHTSDSGRRKAAAMVQNKEIEVFFMEWATPIDSTNIAGSFTGLNTTDAKPSLEALARSCVENAVTVVACDLSVAATAQVLNKLDPGRAPYNDQSAFMPWGQAVRDQHATLAIQAYFTNNSAVESALVMFGAGHFVVNGVERHGVPPLDKLLQAALPDWECRLVEP